MRAIFIDGFAGGGGAFATLWPIRSTKRDSQRSLIAPTIREGAATCLDMPPIWCEIRRLMFHDIGLNQSPGKVREGFVPGRMHLPNWRSAIRSAFARIGLDVRRLPPAGKADYIRLFGEAAIRQRRFYNVGAGAFRHPCWTNIDKASPWYACVQGTFIEHDLMLSDPLPIPDATAEIIYSSHVIEHLKEDAVARLFREAYRALRPGGVIRITTGPDADLDLAALRRGDDDWFYWDPSDRPIEHKWLYHLAAALAPQDPTRCRKMTVEEVRAMLDEPDLLDRLTSAVHYQYRRPGNHVSWWNAGKLLRFMREAGFDAYRSAYGQSVCPVLRNTRYFDNTHPQISVYAEALR